MPPNWSTKPRICSEFFLSRAELWRLLIKMLEETMQKLSLKFST